MIINETIHFGNNRLFAVDSVLDNTLINKLQELFTLENQFWSNQDVVATPGRLQMPVPVEGPFQETGVLFDLEEYARDTLGPQVSSALSKKVEFTGASIWWDSEGYTTNKHYDQPGVDYALQVYVDQLGKGLSTLGTCFYTDSPSEYVTDFEPAELVARIHYKCNAGYLIEYPWEVLHGLDTVVPPGHERKSIYLRFKDTSLIHRVDGCLVYSN